MFFIRLLRSGDSGQRTSWEKVQLELQNWKEPGIEAILHRRRHAIWQHPQIDRLLQRERWSENQPPKCGAKNEATGERTRQMGNQSRCRQKDGSFGVRQFWRGYLHSKLLATRLYLSVCPSNHSLIHDVWSFWPHRLCPHCPHHPKCSSEITAPAHLHATGVAVYPVLFCLWCVFW